MKKRKENMHLNLKKIFKEWTIEATLDILLKEIKIKKKKLQMTNDGQHIRKGIIFFLEKKQEKQNFFWKNSVPFE